METTDWFSGDRLYGDDFSDAEIATWFADEQRGYFEVSNGEAQKRPEYDTLNELTLFQHVRGHATGVCLALGAAAGNDVRPLASMFDSFIAIEPTREFWTDRIGGKPASYRMPAMSGKIDLPDNSVNAVTTIGVLHHIPNVSDVLRELHRILMPGGFLLLREPMVTMGDWSKPRRGVTKNERGLPRRWLLERLAEFGYRIERTQTCQFGPLPRIFHALGVQPYQSKTATRLDLVVSRLTAWNTRYHRTSFTQKFAPASIAVVARKPHQKGSNPGQDTISG